MMRDLVFKNRSYRRFHTNEYIDSALLREWVDYARCCPSGANLQPLKYAISDTPEKNERIYPHLAWAGYLREWEGPTPSERPTAYIIILHDEQVSKTPGCDHGIAAQTILLAATEAGYGGCMVGAINRDEISAELNLPDHLTPILVVALGKPAETVILEPTGPDESIRYYRDDKDRHHVPKRLMHDVLIDWS